VKEYIQTYWNIICYFHPLVTFFPIHTFCLQVLQKISEDSFNEPVSSAYTVVFILCLVGNFWLSFTSTHIYHLIIKTKDPLASKNNYLKGKDIVVKSIIPILWTYSEDTPWLQSFIIVVLFLDAVSKDVILFRLLPYYHINVLEICASMQGAQTALASTLLLTRMLTNTKLGLGNYFVLMCWFVLIPILAKVYRAILWRVLKKILASTGFDLSVHYLIHKAIIIRHLMKKREIRHKESTRAHHTYLMFEGVTSSLIKDTNGLYDRKTGLTKENLVKNLKYFYEGVVDYHPDSDLAKVNLAHYYVKYEGAYLLANNLIEEVMKGIPRFSTRLSLSLIQYQLQKKLLNKYSQEGSDGLNILKYVQTNMVNNKLKQRMKKQVKLQLEFWANFLSNQPDMGKLVLLSQRVDIEKGKVNKAWKEVVKLKSGTFASPLLLYGVYISYVSNNAAEGEKYMEKYHTVAQKLKKIAQSDELNNDTIMFEDTIQISMSGSKTKIGRILDCSTNIEQGLGWKKNFIIGRPIILIMPPFYKSKHDRFLLNHYNTGETKIINRTDVLPVMASDGFIRPTSTHIKMNPLVEQGISYIAVLRPLKHPRRMILIRKDGTIDAMSKDFAMDMNINPQQLLEEELNVFNFCPDFRAINTVFNIMASNTMKQLAPPHTPRTTKRLTHHHHHKGGATLATKKAANSLQVDKQSMVDFSKASERVLQQMEEETGIGSQLGGLLSSPGGQEPGSRPLSLIKEGSFNMNRSPNRAKSVFENYTQGAKLVFHPQRDYVVDENKIKIFNLEHHHGHHGHHHGVTYNVQIINKVHGTEFIKVVYLEKVLDEDPDHHEPSLSYMTNPRPSQADGTRFSFKGHNTMREHSLFKKGSVTDRALMSPNSQDLTNHQSILSPHNNLLSSTKRFFIKEEQEEKEEDHQNNSDTMDVFDENGSQMMVRDNVLGHEGILSSSRDHVFLSSGRLLKNGVEKKATGDVGRRGSETPKTAMFYGCELTPEGEKFDLLAKMKTATFEKDNLKAIVENVREHNENHDDIKPAENSILANQSGGGGTTGYEGEDNDILRLKLRRLKEKFNTAMINKVRKESSVGSSYLSKERKVQKLIAKVLNMDLYKKSARIFIYCYLIYIMLVLVIESVQAATIFSAIDGIEGKVSVVKNGVFRLRSLINVSKYSTMLNGVWVSGLSLFDDWTEDNAYVLTNLGDWVSSLNTYNENFMEQVSQISVEYQYAFFQKNVRMYQRDANDDLVLLAKESNFEAIEQILDKGFRIVNMVIPANSSVATDNTDLRFIIDNAFDDLLVSCENTALALAANLRSGLDSVQEKMLIIYGFLIAMAVLFFFACVRYLIEIRSNSKLFMNMFFRLTEDEVGQSKDLLEHFLKVLETNVHHVEMDSDDGDKKKPHSKARPAKSPTGSSSSTNNSHNQRQKAFRKASMDGLYRQQFKQFGMLTPIYLFIIMINLGYLLLARNTVTQILKEEAQIEASLKSLYQQTLVVAEFFELILTNGQTTVRNNNIVTEFEENLEITKNADGIVENFRDKNGELTTDQQNAFYSFACEDFNYYNLDDLNLLLEFCPIVGNGEDQVGLVAITLELYTLMTYYYDLYENSDKTLPSIRKIFIDCIGDIQGPVLLSQALWNILYDATELSFHSKTTSIRNQAVAFTIVIILLMFLGAVVLWARVIKRIFLLERIDRNVLQLVPIRIILANRFLKQYLLRNADGMLDSVRKFL